MEFNAEAQQLFSERRGVKVRWLFWAEPKNRTTGLTETIGLWTGEYDQEFTPDATARQYHGAAGLLGQSEPTFETGLSVRTHTVTLGALTPEVKTLLMVYDTRLAPVDIYMAIYDPLTDVLVDLVRTFKGTFDAAPISTPEVNGKTTAKASFVSSVREGTRSLPLKKSDANQTLRGGDRIRKYGEVSGTITTVWGGEKVSTPFDSVALSLLTGNLPSSTAKAATTTTFGPLGLTSTTTKTSSVDDYTGWFS